VADDLGRVDLTDLDTFANGFPHGVFRLHREVAPVWWHEPTVHWYELAGTVEWTRSNRHSGIRHLPLRIRRVAR
jgi:hypothetical protein